MTNWFQAFAFIFFTLNLCRYNQDHPNNNTTSTNNDDASSSAAAAVASSSGSGAKPPADHRQAPYLWPPGLVDCYERGVRLLCAALDPEELAEVVPELMACLAEHVRSSPLVVLDPTSAVASSGSGMGGLGGLGSTKLPVELPRLTAHAPLVGLYKLNPVDP